MSQKGVEKTGLTIKTRGGNPILSRGRKDTTLTTEKDENCLNGMDVDERNCKKNSISSGTSTNQVVICSFRCTYLWNRPFHRAGCCSGNAWMVSDLISWLSRPAYTQFIYFSPLQNFHTHPGPTGHPIEGYQGREGDLSPRLVSSV